MANLHSTTTSDRVNVKGAIWAGLLAGVVFMIMEMILVALTGGSPWGPPRMMAAMVMGQDVLPPPASFDLVIFMVAMIVHFVLSVVLAFVFAWCVSRWHPGFGAAVALGAVFGLLVYLVNFYPITALLFPWFAMARNWITISSHIVFGIALAWAYLAIPRNTQGAARPQTRHSR